MINKKSKTEPEARWGQEDLRSRRKWVLGPRPCPPIQGPKKEHMGSKAPIFLCSAVGNPLFSDTQSILLTHIHKGVN